MWTNFTEWSLGLASQTRASSSPPCFPMAITKYELDQIYSDLHWASCLWILLAQTGSNIQEPMYLLILLLLDDLWNKCQLSHKSNRLGMNMQWCSSSRIEQRSLTRQGNSKANKNWRIWSFFKLLTLVQVCQGNKALHQILHPILYQKSQLCMIYQENREALDPQVNPSPSGEVLGHWWTHQYFRQHSF